MGDHLETLLRCIPRKVLARWRDAGAGVPEKRESPVAVLMVDIEACTRLCEDLAPAEMNRLIERHFSIFFDEVERAGGTVNEIMGDGFMALFDEGDLRCNARAAVSAALAIQRKTADMNARDPAGVDPLLVNIGVHAGIGFVGFTKFQTLSGERWTYTASGPVTNVAARLCALADGGSILVSGDVASFLEGGGYALEALGPQKLKNVSRPVPAFRLS